MVRFLARHPMVGVAIFMSIFVVGCVPVRLEASWPALSLIEESNDIVLTYNDRIVLIDPVSGEPVKLRNVDGEVRLDENGNPRMWEFTGTEGQARQFYSAPLQINPETLLVATYADRHMYEVDLPTARIITTTQVDLPGQVTAGLAMNADQIYVGISERNLLALDSQEFSTNWTFPTGQGVWSEPLIIDDVLYFASLDHFVYALDADSGDEIWRLDLEGAAPGTPFYHNGHLYLGSFARKIYDISMNGEILAEYTTDNWVWGEPTVVDDVLYAADLNGTVYALDVADGSFSEKWKAQVGTRAIRATPVVADDYVIVGSRDHKLYWLNRSDGTLVEDQGTVDNVQNFRVREMSGEILSDMLLIEPSDTLDIPEPYVIVSSIANEELLSAFTVSNGERIWTYGR